MLMQQAGVIACVRGHWLQTAGAEAWLHFFFPHHSPLNDLLNFSAHRRLMGDMSPPVGNMYHFLLVATRLDVG